LLFDCIVDDDDQPIPLSLFSWSIHCYSLFWHYSVLTIIVGLKHSINCYLLLIFYSNLTSHYLTNWYSIDLLSVLLLLLIDDTIVIQKPFWYSSHYYWPFPVHSIDIVWYSIHCVLCYCLFSIHCVVIFVNSMTRYSYWYWLFSFDIRYIVIIHLHLLSDIWRLTTIRYYDDVICLIPFGIPDDYIHLLSIIDVVIDIVDGSGIVDTLFVVTSDTIHSDPVDDDRYIYFDTGTWPDTIGIPVLWRDTLLYSWWSRLLLMMMTDDPVLFNQYSVIVVYYRYCDIPGIVIPVTSTYCCVDTVCISTMTIPILLLLLMYSILTILVLTYCYYYCQSIDIVIDCDIQWPFILLFNIVWLFIRPVLLTIDSHYSLWRILPK